MKVLIALLTATALPVWGQDTGELPITGAEFDAYTLGKTLSYFQDGVGYGAEQYLGGQHVVWAFNGDQCIEGRWYEPEPRLICFEYDGAVDGAQCWHFYRSDNGLRAVFDAEIAPTELYEVQQGDEALFCPGPEVGA